MDKYLVNVNLPFDFGLDADNTNPRSALFRPWRRLAETGNPTGKVNYIFVQFHGQVWTVGSLCHSPRGLLLFFPGFEKGNVTTWMANEPASKTYKRFQVDHFSLEKTLDRWHLTNARSEHIGSFKVSLEQQDLIHWFAVSVCQPSELEALCRRNRWAFPCPDTDSQRRMRDLVQSRDEAVDRLIIHEDPTITSGGSFLHFNFFVSKRAELDAIPEIQPGPDRRAARISIPPPYLLTCHCTHIPGFTGTVAVCAMQIPGELSMPVVVTSA